MRTKVEFFYDYISLYSYLADSQLADLDGAEIIYRPMLLGAVMQATGNRAPGIVEAKEKHLHVDADRWAKRYSMPFNWNPVFPQNTANALRLALVAEKRGAFEAVHQPLFNAMWVEEKDLGDESVVSEIAANVSITIGDIRDPEIKEELKANTSEAVERGVFGAPTFFIGDEMFFGNDRFDFIREEIKNRG